MTKYESLMEKSGKAAVRAAKTADPHLRKFYRNAAEGFLTKARNLSLKEAGEPA